MGLIFACATTLSFESLTSKSVHSGNRKVSGNVIVVVSPSLTVLFGRLNFTCTWKVSHICTPFGGIGFPSLFVTYISVITSFHSLAFAALERSYLLPSLLGVKAGGAPGLLSFFSSTLSVFFEAVSSFTWLESALASVLFSEAGISAFFSWLELSFVPVESVEGVVCLAVSSSLDEFSKPFFVSD